VDEVLIQVSCRAIRSGGRGRDTMSFRGMEFLSRDRMLREKSKNFLFGGLVDECREDCTKGSGFVCGCGPGLVWMSPDSNNKRMICLWLMTDDDLR
jgi:hypothetical protein